MSLALALSFFLFLLLFISVYHPALSPSTSRLLPTKFLSQVDFFCLYPDRVYDAANLPSYLMGLCTSFRVMDIRLEPPVLGRGLLMRIAYASSRALRPLGLLIIALRLDCLLRGVGLVNCGRAAPMSSERSSCPFVWPLMERPGTISLSWFSCLCLRGLRPDPADDGRRQRELDVGRRAAHDTGYGPFADFVWYRRGFGTLRGFADRNVGSPTPGVDAMETLFLPSETSLGALLGAVLGREKLPPSIVRLMPPPIKLLPGAVFPIKSKR
jgi:hypothetical protein